MGKCLYCQLEKQDKVYVRHGFEHDFCDAHKGKFKPTSYQLDFIDDGIDLEAEADEINREIDEERRKEYLDTLKINMPRME